MIIKELLETQRISWERGSPVLVEEFLKNYPALFEAPDHLSQLIAREVAFKEKAGDEPAAGDYLALLPDFEEMVTQIFEMPTQIAHSGVERSYSQESTVFPRPESMAMPEVADYEILSEIARGGMGVVYKARQISANRIVALKMIRSSALAGESELSRFRVEAEAAASLDHPGIVPVFDVGASDGENYFSMGYVDGPSLAARLADGPMEPKAAAGLVRAIAGAICHAHDKGVVHRDLKPANVLLAEGDFPRVTDFGLAKLMTEDSGLTMTGQIMGTPSYMAPEQASGRADIVGPLSDQYSLGAILYHAVTGAPPFQAPSVVKIIDQVQNKEPVPPRQINPGVDRDLDTIILKTLEKDPSARYQNTMEFSMELDRYLGGLPIHARPISSVARVVRWSQRNKVVAGLLGALGLGLLSAAIGASVVALEFREQAATERTLREDREVALKLEEEARGLEADARMQAEEAVLQAGRMLYASNTLENSEAFDRPEIAGSIVGLNLDYWHPGAWEIRGREIGKPHVFANLKDPPDLRGWEHFMLAAITNVETEETAGFDTTSRFTGATASSHDGRLAFATMTGITVGTAVEFRSARFTPVDQTKIYSLDFHPDGTRLASAGKDGTVRLWQVGEKVGKELHRIDHGAVADFVAFDQSGEILASHTRDGKLHILNLKTLTEQTTISGVPEKCFRALSPDGSLIAVGVKESDMKSVVQIYDTKTGILRYTLDKDGHTDTIQGLDFSPDSRSLVSCGGDKAVLIWDIETEAVQLRMKEHTLRVLRVAWSHDGKWIASAGDDRVVKIWNVRTGEILREFTRHRLAVLALHWSPDGRYVYSAGFDTEFVVNDLGIPPPIQSFSIGTVEAGGKSFALNWSPDGSKVSATIGELHSLIDLDTRVADSERSLKHLCWSHDGRLQAGLRDGKLVIAGEDGLVGEAEIDPAVFAHLSWSPKGDPRVVFLDGDEVKIWEVGGGRSPKTIYTMETIDGLGWKPDGRAIAVSTREDLIRIIDAVTGKSLANFHSSPPNTGMSQAYAVRWDADLELFAVACRTSDAVIFDARTWEVKSKLDHGLSVRDVAWSPSGQPKRLATACDDMKVRIWDAGNELLLMALPHDNPVQQISWSPGGRKIAVLDDRGNVKIWNASHGYLARGNIDEEIRDWQNQQQKIKGQ